MTWLSYRLILSKRTSCAYDTQMKTKSWTWIFPAQRRYWRSRTTFMQCWKFPCAIKIGLDGRRIPRMRQNSAKLASMPFTLSSLAEWIPKTISIAMRKYRILFFKVEFSGTDATLSFQTTWDWFRQFSWRIWGRPLECRRRYFCRATTAKPP